MKAFIIEDEIPAQINLKRALKLNFDDIEIAGTADSVTGAVKWINTPGNHADIIFMDVELSDGMCFEIFKRAEIRSKVIITTAYDTYAIKAFKVNSVDYLLKPVDAGELVAAVEKCRAAANDRNARADDMASLNAAAVHLREYKPRFAVKLGNRIIVVNVGDIAYICSEDKTAYIVTFDNSRYILDQSLDAVCSSLDGRKFFRISRGCITSINAIKSVSRHFGGRIKITLNPATTNDLFVSRGRVHEFMRWLDGE